MTQYDLKRLYEAKNPNGKFFTRNNMRFAGDTMKNYSVKERGKYWFELARIKPTAKGASKSVYFHRESMRYTANEPMELTLPVVASHLSLSEVLLAQCEAQGEALKQSGMVWQSYPLHATYWKYPGRKERGIVNIVKALITYADAFRMTNESNIGEDYVIGDYWYDMVISACRLLDADCGRLDCGLLSELLTYMLVKEGFDVDSL